MIKAMSKEIYMSNGIYELINNPKCLIIFFLNAPLDALNIIIIKHEQIDF